LPDIGSNEQKHAAHGSLYIKVLCLTAHVLCISITLSSRKVLSWDI